MAESFVLSYVQARPLLAAHTAGHERADLSLDLGLTSSQVGFSSDGVALPSGDTLAWSEVERIARAENVCFIIEACAAREIRVFSDHTNWLRSLMPTSGAPTMLVSGIAMHRIKETEPHRDTLAKIATIAPFTGRVLDTATGLGYTAIEAARTADEVITVELDPAGLEVARLNPWSRDLFVNPRIHQIIGDVCEEILKFPDQAFDRIVHDPPMFTLAGELYSGAFYAQLKRVLRRKGRLFHYIGDPDSQSGRRTTAGVMRRLRETGFTRVIRHPEAFGVVALP